MPAPLAPVVAEPTSRRAPETGRNVALAGAVENGPSGRATRDAPRA
jgi:hypothetical protein